VRKPGELTPDELKRCLANASRAGKWVWLAANILRRPKERADLRVRPSELTTSGLDGIILNDVGLLREVRRTAPTSSRRPASVAELRTSRMFASPRPEGEGVVVFSANLDPDEGAAVKAKATPFPPGGATRGR
jgi:hypothetical protein